MAFDPYHKWLGIPPAEQPPNHYRLLGISLFESDLEVIDAAANRQMGYVQGFANSDHATDSQKLLNELAAARICLLDGERRATYDAGLGYGTASTLVTARPKLMTFGAVSSESMKKRRALGDVTSHSQNRSEGSQGSRIRPPGEEAVETVAVNSGTANEAPDRDSPIIERPLPRIIRSRSRRSTHTSEIVTGAAILSVMVIVGILVTWQLPNRLVPRAKTEAASNSSQRVKPSNSPGVETDKTTQGGTESEPSQPDAASVPAQVSNSLEASVVDAKTDKQADQGAVSSIDLLKSFRLPDDVITGDWKFEGTSLIAPKDQRRPAVLILPHPPWPEYVLTIEEETIEEGLLILGLVSGDAQFSACLDWNNGKYWLQSFTNQGLQDNESTQRPPALVTQIHRTIVCKVTKERVSILIDGHLVLDWYGDYSRFNDRPLALVEIPDQSALFLASWGVHKINKFSIEPVRTNTGRG